MEKEEIVNKIKESKEVFERFDVVAVYLFGSTVRGESHERSDIDVGILFREQPDIRKLISLYTDLSRSMDMEVDVSCLNQDDVLFLHDVITEGILVYESDKEERVDFEVEVDKKYHDQKPVIEEYWLERRKRVLAHA